MSDQVAAMGYLSPAQQGILFHSLEASGTGVYLVQSRYRLEGKLDRDAFARAWQSAVDRHPILRTAFVWEDVDEPVQVVHEHLEVPVEFRDWRGVPEAEQKRRADAYLEAGQRRRLDMAEAPLMRLALFRLGEGSHLFVWSLHHILLDGWSKVLVLREVLETYEAFCRGEAQDLPTPRPYLDYIGWLRRQDQDAAREFWRELLAGYRTPLRLPGGGSPSDRGRTRRVVEELSEAGTKALEAAARRYRVTLNTLVSLAWGLTLAHHGNRRDVVFGTVVSGRPPSFQGVEEMVGMFINTLPTRVRLRPGELLPELLQATHRQHQQILRHQGSALVDVQGVSEVPRGEPLFETILTFESFPVDEPLKRWGGDLEIHPEPALSSINYPLSVAAFPGPRLKLEVKADRGRFARTVADRLGRFFVRLLESMAADPEVTVDRLDGLSPAQRHQILVEWNDRSDPPTDGTLPELWQAGVAQRPDAVALVSGDQDAGQLSYGELDRRAARLTRGLRSLGVGRETVVGLEVGRSPALVVGFWAIQKAGGVYLPMDPAYPPERRRWMADDAGARVILSRVPGDKDVDLGDGWWGRLSHVEDPAAPGPPSVSSLAYVIYTSGSTGRPKGVAVPHGDVVAHVRDWARFLSYGPRDRTLQFAAMGFDASVEQIVAPLVCGATLVLRGEAVWSPRELWRRLADLQVTVAHLPTAYWQELLPEELGERPAVASLRWMRLGGEALPAAAVGRWRRRGPRGVRLLNGYGPTEAVITASRFEVPEEAEIPEGRTVSLGRPAAGRRAYVFDALGRPAPVGAPGELCLGGVGLARGYLGAPTRTAESFVPDPYAESPGARLYRTGDLTCRRGDGMLDFLGRLDDQVKIRGFRVEPREIQSILLHHPSVETAAVVVREDTTGPELMACVVPTTDEAPSVETLERHLGRSLPDYMVPTAWTFLGALPRTPNGKVDRRALEAIEPEGRRKASSTPLQTPTEELLAGIWEGVLQVDGVGREDDFFRLGGHSLLATRLVSRVARAFGVELPLTSIFEHSRLREMAHRVSVSLGYGDEGEEWTEVRPVERELGEALPLSLAQRRLWFLDRLEPGSPLYNIPLVMEIRGRLDAKLLERSLRHVVGRHESLRTVFSAPGEEPRQRVLPAQPIRVLEVGLTALAPKDRDTELRRLARREALRPFELTAGPLLRFGLVRLERRRFAAFLTLHHIVADGWSMGVLVRELGAAYRAFSEDRESPLPELSIQYADYARWQQERLGDGELERQIDYWRERLDGTAVLQLPTDRPRPAVMRHRGASLPVSWPRDLTRRLEQTGRDRGATLFMVLLAAFQLLLGRLAGQHDVAVGSPVSGRGRPEIEDLIGFFVNTIVLRGDLSRAPTFEDYLGRLREAVIGAFAHQDVPFERIVEEVQPQRNRSHSPLFQVAFALQNDDVQPLELPELSLEPLRVGSAVAKFDLLLSLAPVEHGIEGVMVYDRDLFDHTTAARWIRCFRTLLEEIVEAPEETLDALTLLSPAERHQLRAEWNDTATSYPRESTIHGLFEDQATARPDAVAVVTERGKVPKHLSYRELDRRANRLAHHLQAHGVGAEVPVGLCLERSMELVVAILGILKAGGAYVPLDPSYPQSRLELMVGDAQLPLILSHEACWQNLPAHLAELVLIDGDWDLIATESDESPRASVAAQDLAYVVYTSGSTGRPKGVRVPHRGPVRLVREAGFMDFSPRQVFLQLAPVAFDASTLELWGPLLNGGRLVVMPPGRVSLEELGRTLERHQVTSLWLTSGLFHQMVDFEPERLVGVEQLLAGGDVLSVPHVERVLAISRSYCRMINGYGPTENTTFTTTHRAGDRPLIASVPIGRPIADTRVRVLDPGFQEVPVGVVGELYAAGDGLARDYLSRPALTAERFVPAPSGASHLGERLYRTGDQVRWLPDGHLEFLGRLDHQVKLRGFRIELGEVQAVLASHPTIEQVGIVVRKEDSGEQRLVAYWVARGEGEERPTAVELRSFLEERLPSYMVPTAFVELDELPLTANGKLDRRALPAPEEAAGAASEKAPGAGSAPRTPTEELLSSLWTEVLKVPAVGLHDDFFDLGGHSLLATQLVSRVRDLLDVELPLSDLFGAPTVAAMATLVERQRRQKPQLEAPPLVPVSRNRDLPLSFAQQRLWFIDRYAGGTAAYNISAAVHLHGSLDATVLESGLAQIVRRHEALRTNFRHRGGEPVQVIDPDRGFRLPVVDLSSLPASRIRLEATRMERRESRRLFDLSGDPLFRGALLRRSDDHHSALLTLHHTVGDGWSIGVLIRELQALYEAAMEGVPPELPELPIQYADFAVWQRNWLSGEVLEAQLDYWRRQLAEAPASLDLPVDRPRSPELSSRGAIERALLPTVLVDEIRTLGTREGATLFMTLLAGFAVLLGRWAGEEHVVVSSPSANRNRSEIEGLIGFFVNTLALATDLTGDPGVRELLARVRKVTLGAYEHQDLPFEKVVEELAPERQLDRHPLTQVMFILQSAQTETLELPEIEADMTSSHVGFSELDLVLSVVRVDDGMRLIASYSPDLFDHTTVRRLLDHWMRLLESMVEDSSRPLSELPWLSVAERHQMLVEWNDTETPTSGATLPELWAEQVRRSPAAEALVAGEQRFPYAELDRRSARLARCLRDLGVGPEVRVGVALERTIDLPVTLLAVLRAGGAYVPLDPNYPRERLAFMIEDSAMAVLVTREGLLSDVAEDLPRIDPRGSADDPADDVEALDSEPWCNPSSLAYVIYTSGSTGRPKGVELIHRGVVELVEWSRSRFSDEEMSGMLAATSVSFDLSVFEIFVTWCRGGRVILADDALALPRLPARDQVRLINTVPSAANELVRQGAVPESVTTVALAGEPLPRHLVDGLHATGSVRRVLNLYGPSEDTTYSTWEEVPPGPEEPKIGRPVTATRAFVLDARMQPVAVGVVGELYLTGRGLARGYHRRPARTAERFLPDPSGPDGSRLYRTGDRVRYGRDGRLAFLGRIDHQVKIRGFRIELGEIESRLLEHPTVDETVVVTRPDASGEQGLVAYLVSKTELEAAELRHHLARTLPAYMVPPRLVWLDEMPLLPNGKIDRRALPAPEEAGRKTGEPKAPRDALELRLLTVWQELFQREDLGTQDDFFELGGHSLLAVRLLDLVERELGTAPSLATLFQNPTVEGMAEHLRRQPSAATREPTPLVEIQSGSNRSTPTFLIHGAGGSLFRFMPLVRALGPEQTLYGLQSTPESPGPDSLVERAVSYTDAIRSVRPGSPPRLIGWSMGGVVALEMARRLEARGETMDRLILLDAWLPGSWDRSVEVDPVEAFARGLGVPGDVLRQAATRLPADAGTGERLAQLRKTAEAVGLLPSGMDDGYFVRFFNLYRRHQRALEEHAPGTYRGHGLLIQAAETPEEALQRQEQAWRRVILGGLEVLQAPGDHVSILKPPGIEEIVRKLGEDHETVPTRGTVAEPA